MRSKSLSWVLPLFLVLISGACFGADPAGAVDSVAGAVGGFATSALAGTVAVIMEFVFRLLPTKSPLSWLWVLDSIFKALSRLTNALAAALDRVLPQNVVPPKPESIPKP